TCLRIEPSMLTARASVTRARVLAGDQLSPSKLTSTRVASARQSKSFVAASADLSASLVRKSVLVVPHAGMAHAPDRGGNMLFGRKQRNPIKIADKGVVEWRYATCGYCSTGCALEIGINAIGTPVATRGSAGADVNRGKLCIKGIFEHELFTSSGRGTVPLLRQSRSGPPAPVTWDAALDRFSREIKRIQTVHG